MREIHYYVYTDLYLTITLLLKWLNVDLVCSVCSILFIWMFEDHWLERCRYLLVFGDFWIITQLRLRWKFQWQTRENLTWKWIFYHLQRKSFGNCWICLNFYWNLDVFTLGTSCYVQSYMKKTPKWSAKCEKRRISVDNLWKINYSGHFSRFWACSALKRP